MPAHSSCRSQGEGQTASMSGQVSDMMSNMVEAGWLQQFDYDKLMTLTEGCPGAPSAPDARGARAGDAVQAAFI